MRADKPTEATLGSSAPDVELASTDGSTVSLADHPATTCSSTSGVGCDACFYHQAKIEAEHQRFTDAGLTVLPVVVNHAADGPPGRREPRG